LQKWPPCHETLADSLDWLHRTLDEWPTRNLFDALRDSRQAALTVNALCLTGCRQREADQQRRNNNPFWFISHFKLR